MQPTLINLSTCLCLIDLNLSSCAVCLTVCLTVCMQLLYLPEEPPEGVIVAIKSK